MPGEGESWCLVPAREGTFLPRIVYTILTTCRRDWNPGNDGSVIGRPTPSPGLLSYAHLLPFVQT